MRAGLASVELKRVDLRDEAEERAPTFLTERPALFLEDAIGETGPLPEIRKDRFLSWTARKKKKSP